MLAPQSPQETLCPGGIHLQHRVQVYLSSGARLALAASSCTVAWELVSIASSFSDTVSSKVGSRTV